MAAWARHAVAAVSLLALVAPLVFVEGRPIATCPVDGRPCPRYRLHIMASARTSSDAVMDLATESFGEPLLGGDGADATFLMYEPLHGFWAPAGTTKGQRIDDTLRCIYHCNCTNELLNARQWSWTKFANKFESYFGRKCKGVEDYNAVCKGPYNIVLKTIAPMGNSESPARAPAEWGHVAILRDPRGTYLSRLTTPYIPTRAPAFAIPHCCAAFRDIIRTYQRLVDAGRLRVYVFRFEQFVADAHAAVAGLWREAIGAPVPAALQHKIEKHANFTLRVVKDGSSGTCALPKATEWRSKLTQAWRTKSVWANSCEDVFRAMQLPTSDRMDEDEASLCALYKAAFVAGDGLELLPSELDWSKPALDIPVGGQTKPGPWPGVLVRGKSVVHSH